MKTREKLRVIREEDIRVPEPEVDDDDDVYVYQYHKYDWPFKDMKLNEVVLFEGSEEFLERAQSRCHGYAAGAKKATSHKKFRTVQEDVGLLVKRLR